MKPKFLSLSVLFFLAFFNVIAQPALNGTFCKTEKVPGFGSCLEFSGSNFKYTRGGDIYSIGEGTYIKKKNQLLLHYKSLPPLKMSYHRLGIWENYADSIKVEIRVLDLDQSPVPGVNVLYTTDTQGNKYDGIILDTQGEGSLKFPGEQEEVKLQFSNVGYQSHIVDIIANKSYLIEVFLSNDSAEIPID